MRKIINKAPGWAPFSSLILMRPNNVNAIKAVLRAAAVAALACNLGYAQDDVADEPELRFPISEYRVGGNTVLAAVDVERAVYPFLGPNKTAADVEQARQALEAIYREKGYSTALVSTPEQSVDSGIVRLEVTEGNVGRVRVTQARYVSGRQIAGEMTAASPGEPIHFPELQTNLSRINRVSPDRAVTPILKPGRNPGEVDLELRVDDTFPVHASFELNDQYTVDTEELRSTVSLAYDNLWQRFHSFSVQYTTAPENQENTEVWAGTYLWRFRDRNDVLAFYAVDTASDVATVGDINVLGNGRIYGFRWVKPLASDSSFFHSTTVGVDYKDFDESIDDTLETPVSYTHLSGSYNFGWNLDSYRSSYGVGAGFAIRALGNSPEEFENKRFNANPNYFYLQANTEQLLRIWGGVGLYGKVAGQYTTKPLINNEQFSIGGFNTVRGYLEAERLGDFGAFGTFEVRSPDFGRAIWDEISTFYLFAFYDAGTVAIHQPLPGQDPSSELFSTGVGFRFATEFGLTAALDWARPLRQSVNIDEDEDRLHFALRWGF